MYRLTATARDHNLLQEDLQKLENWEQQWDMTFHPGKCTTLPVTKKRNPAKSEYTLHDYNLETAQEAKYLGITITKDSWDKHISNVCTKANKTLGFLCRIYLKISSKSIKETAYKTFVRPILEYACTIWDPYQSSISKIEAV